MLAKLTNFKVAHWTLVALAVAAGVMRNHGIITHDDFDLIAAGLGAFGLGLNVPLNNTSSSSILGAPTAAPDPGPTAQV